MILGCDSAKSKSVPTSRGPFFIRTTVFKMYPRGVCVSQVRRAAFQSILQDQAHGDGLADSRVRGNGGPTILGVALSGGGAKEDWDPCFVFMALCSGARPKRFLHSSQM